MSKKSKFIIWFSAVALILFIGGYFSYCKYSKASKYNEELYRNSNSVMSKNKIQNTIKYNTNLIFRTVYLKSNHIAEEKQIAEKYDKSIIGYDREKLQSYFLKKDFKINAMNGNEVILTKSVDRYAPNKYVIGIEKTEKGEYISIFRTDNEGKMYIEDKEDITGLKTNLLRKEDVEMLKNGCSELQFDTKEKAKEAVTEYES
ncbi:hypothetical protein [Haloimpatiens lingqiaonensis]|uniref:hypothetical protein n=1 Tax=Haloimpatiens lingqiaonensis TaxID=1380675 RepID=UPI0010FD2386|nr:hypothetical protein [Haloimpatiens lingqiaonensis]